MNGSGDPIDEARQESARALIDSLALPSVVTWAQLQARVEEVRGKAIRLNMVADRDFPTTGWMNEHETFYALTCRSWDKAVVQQHAIFHELGHILYGHRGCHVLEQVPHDLFDSEGMRGGILAAFARGLTLDEDELEAEAFAYTLMNRMVRAAIEPGTEVFGV